MALRSLPQPNHDDTVFRGIIYGVIAGACLGGLIIMGTAGSVPKPDATPPAAPAPKPKALPHAH